MSANSEVNNQEKKARDEADARDAFAGRYAIDRDPDETLEKIYDSGDLCMAVSDGWDACADWQAKRENSPDIRADNVMSIEDHACNTGDCDHYFQKDCDKTLAAYRDAQYRNSIKLPGDKVSDSIAEFPEAEFVRWNQKQLYKGPGFLPDRHHYRIAEWGFERGRASREPDMNYWYDRGQSYLNQYNKLHAKLAEAQAEIERLKEKHERT